MEKDTNAGQVLPYLHISRVFFTSTITFGGISQQILLLL